MVNDCSILTVQRQKMRDRQAIVGVCTVVTALVVADQRLLLESTLMKCTRSQRYVGQSWWSERCIRV